MDHYQTLGVKPGATAEDIRAAYRRLARQHHPDLNGSTSDDARIKAINEAYGVLGNAHQRKAYDRRHSSHDLDLDNAFAGSLHDLFETLFARAGGGREIYRLGLSLEQVFNGGTHTIEMGDEKISIQIEPGLTEGTLIRVPGHDNTFLQIAYLPHPLFQVQDGQVFGLVSIDPWTLALGGQVRVQTLGGWVLANIPQGVQPGQRIHLADRGMPAWSTREAGGHWARVQVEIPAASTQAQQQAWEAVRKAYQDKEDPEKTAPG